MNKKYIDINGCPVSTLSILSYIAFCILIPWIRNKILYIQFLYNVNAA